MLMRSFILCFITLSLLGGTHTTATAQENHQIFKWNGYGFIRDVLWMDRYTIEVQREKAFSKNNKFSSFVSLSFRGKSYEVYNTGSLVNSGFEQSWTAKLGGRYYFSQTPQAYDGLFVAAAPFYAWNNQVGRDLQRHNIGLDVGFGYQYQIGRWALETNLSCGYAGSWYKQSDPIHYKEEEGFEEQVFTNLQINIGYLFKTK